MSVRNPWAKGLLLGTWLFFVASSLAGPKSGHAAHEDADARVEEILAPGVVLDTVRRARGGLEITFWLCRVSREFAHLGIVRAATDSQGHPGLEPVSEMARRSGAIFAVNGGFFSPRDRMPLGLLKVAGELVSGPLYRRSVLRLGSHPAIDRPQVNPWILLPSGESAEVDFVNFPRQDESLVLYTSAWGPRTKAPHTGDTFEIAMGANGEIVGLGNGGLTIPSGGQVICGTGARADWLRTRLQQGDVVVVGGGLDEYWGPVSDALGGGPLLVADGAPAVAQDERFRPDVMEGRAGRTAIGITPDGTMLLFVVAGTDFGASVGMTLEELALEFVIGGAQRAMNLDGGSSSTVWANGETRNKPLGEPERNVANALVVYPNSDGDATESP